MAERGPAACVGKGPISLVAGLRVHAEQIAVAQLSQHKRFTVLLQVDSTLVQAGLRARTEVDHVSIGLVTTTWHLLQWHQAQIGAESAQRRGAFAGTDASSITDHLQRLHRQRRFQRDQLLFGHLGAEAPTALVQAEPLQRGALRGRQWCVLLTGRGGR